MSAIIKIKELEFEASENEIITDIKNKILEYEKYFNETGKKTNFDLLGNIAKLFKLSDASGSNHYKLRNNIMNERLNEIIPKLIFLCNNLNVNTLKSILNLFNSNLKNCKIANAKLYQSFVVYFTDIDILTKMFDLICISNCIIEYIKNILINIEKYSENAINENIQLLKNIINNLNICNNMKKVTSKFDIDLVLEISSISEFLFRQKRIYMSNSTENKSNGTENKLNDNDNKRYKLIFDLVNFIFYELNLLETVEFNDSLKKILDRYK